MARPLREQFAVATLLLVLPVCGVIALAARFIYQDQLVTIDEESLRLAKAVVAYIDVTEDIDPLKLRGFITQMQLPQGATLTVRDERGTVIGERSDPGQNLEERHDITAAAQRVKWSVSVGTPTSVAFDRMRSVYRKTVVISGIATLLMLVIEAVFLRSWLRSLVHLERAADRVGSGDLTTPKPRRMPSRELEHLQTAFSGMVDNTRDAREAIARQVVEERRIREELQSLQLQIIRQERLAAIGVLLSGIAHELNNPLQAISGFAELLQRDPGIRPDVRADLAIIQKESRRASAIIRNLSRFSRQQSSTPVNVFLSDTVASVVELRQRHLQEQNVKLTVDEQASQPARAVFAELQQVLLNFIINAEQAVASLPAMERAITIRTRDLDRRVRLEVEDTGPGVAPENESKLFQPFFTTKPVGEGTGLGLSVSYGIIQSYGGTIGYQRADHGGAVFYFELPA